MEKNMDNEMEAGSIMGKIRVILGLNNYNKLRGRACVRSY